MDIIKKAKSLQKTAHERYQNHRNLSEKEKTSQYGCKQYKNVSNDEKQRLIEYRKNYSRILIVKNYKIFSREIYKTAFKDFFFFCITTKIC